LTSSIVISVGLTAYQLATNEALKLKPYLWTLVGVGLPVAVFLAWAEEYRGRGKAQQELDRLTAPARRAVDLSPILDAQLRLSNADASHESRFRQLDNADEAIRADVNEAIQVLTKRVTELSTELASIKRSDVETAQGSLELHSTLRNRVLLLIAELREIGNRIKIVGDYPPAPKPHPVYNIVSSSQLNEHRRKVEDFVGRQTWKQYWDIYHSDFDERVKAIVNDLQQADVASKGLLTFSENLGVDELHHKLPFDVTDRLIPWLLSAADALTRSQSS
jgi:hypothetical protein